jgi:Rv0078B-related antitoxin
VEPIRDHAVRARFEMTLDLFETAEQMVRQRLRREHPELDDQGIEERVVRWLRACPTLDQGGGSTSRTFRPRRRE